MGRAPDRRMQSIVHFAIAIAMSPNLNLIVSGPVRVRVLGPICFSNFLECFAQGMSFRLKLTERN